MAEYDAYLRGIPKFLRRPVESAPEDPVFMAPQSLKAPPPADIPTAFQAPATAPVRRPGSLLSLPETPPKAPPETPEIVSLSARRAAPLPSGNFFVEARESIQGLFATAARDGREEERDKEGDTPFQVTLPRSVIRQIRILAAQEGTTQRATVLKALRLAGLTVPEGADIDRRILAGRRRQQA